MQEDIDIQVTISEEGMQGAIDHFQKELVKVRTGRANPSVLGGIMVDYYGSQTPMNQISNISAPDGRTLMIQPWERKMLDVIERAIINSNLGFAPQNNGEIIRISIPPLTEERRKDYVRRVKLLAEDARVSIRNSRRDLMEAIKEAVKNGYPEDAGKRMEGLAQNLTDKYAAEVDKLAEAKETDIMTI
jgi:ribosome recycling factor